MTTMLETLIAALLLVSSFFTVVGSFGLVKLADFFRRMHAPTKATTLGVGSILIASMLYHPLTNGEFRPRELLITLFLFISAPVSAHMMSKAMLSLRPDTRPSCPDQPAPDPPVGNPEPNHSDPS